MTWVLLWAVLLLGAGAVLFVLGRRLFRQIKALSSELGVASDRLAEVADRLADLEHTGESVAGASDGVGSPSTRQRP